MEEKNNQSLNVISLFDSSRIPSLNSNIYDPEDCKVNPSSSK